jgi:hypothetical protein
MKIKFIKTVFIAVALGTSISSCSVATKSVEAESAKQTFKFEDIYSDGNESSLTISVKDFLDNKVEAENIETAEIKSITVSKNDSIGLSEINSAKLHIMGESEELTMITVGVATSIEEGAKSVTLKIMDDVDVSEYLKAENVTLVLDVNYLNDNENTQNFEVGINIDLEMNEQK